MKKIIYLLIMLLVPCLTLAQRRGEREAISIAQSFWGAPNRAKLRVVPQKNLNKVKGQVSIAPTDKSSYFVVNDEANNRFVIVSSDERLYTILGYSDNGIFDAEAVPEGLLEVLADYDGQYSAIVQHLANLNKINNKRSPVEPVPPLITSKWGQNSPYNDLCPADVTSNVGKNCAGGCVATAMAQVMNYYEYPSTGTGSNSYISDSQRIYQSMDFSTVTFDWSNMVDVYDDNATAAQQEAVAKLIHACGVSISMDYAKSSLALPYDITYSLINFWKYNPNIAYKEKQYYSEAEWNNILMQELKAGHPVLYGGRGSKGGHRFVLDGCDSEGYYHFNFGWNGYGDGFYSLDILRPTDELSGTVSSLGDFSSKQSMVCNITPQEYGESDSEFYTSSGLSLDKLKVGSVTYVGGYIYNYDSNSAVSISSSPKFTGKIGVGLFDKDFNFVMSMAESEVSIRGMRDTYFTGTLNFNKSIFTDGSQYYIAYYVYSADKGYSIVRTEKGLKDYYLAVTKDNEISFSALREMGEPGIAAADVVTGLYNASATNLNEHIEWQIEMWQDEQDSTKYWFADLDPLAKKGGYSYDKGWNKVYGIVNATGSCIEIPVGQSVGSNLKLHNYTGAGHITVYLNAANKTMTIEDVWGCLKQNLDSENVSSQDFSKYSNSRFVYTSVRVTDPEDTEVEAPIIDVSADHVMTLRSQNEGATIYYTNNGSSPTSSSTQYTAPVTLTENCTIKAVAFLNGKLSNVALYTVSDFTCAAPEIHQAANSNTITISCGTADATVYYTLDGKIPNRYSLRYSAPFDITESCILKAVAIRSNYNDSPITSRSVVYYQVSPDVPALSSVTVTVNQAGTLASLVSDSDKKTATSWVISGDLNGTDIKYLREVFEIGKITDLNLNSANIVAGGDAYEDTGYLQYFTEDGVIGNSMFSDSKSLISLILPASTKKIDSYSIDNCDNLARLNIPDNCMEVEEYAIKNCDHLLTIHIGKNVESYDPRNAVLCKSLSEITVDPANKNYKSVDGILFNVGQTTLITYPCAKTDKSYTVGQSVTAIGSYAFSESSLEQIILPFVLVEIGANAFSGCKRLKEITIPANVTKIGSFAFQNCAALSMITIPDKVDELPMFSFAYCINLVKVNIGAGVVDIEGSAFSGAESLQSFEVNANNQKYTAIDGILYTKDKHSIVRCPLAYYIDELIIDDNVSRIESNAFANCRNVAKFRLPDGLKEIGTSAFSNCEMQSITVPSSITDIDMFAFMDCKNLVSFAIPESLKVIPSFMLSGNNNLTYLYIPAAVKKVDGYAFARCQNLRTIESWINDISALELDTDLNGDYTVFENIASDCIWHVPVGCGSKYKSQPWWVSTWQVAEDLFSGIDNSTINNGIEVEPSSDKVIISSQVDTLVTIYNIDGRLIYSQRIESGGIISVPLTKGIYIINGKRFLVR